MARTAVLFPGQGSLTPDAAANARATWPELADRATELLGADPFERAGESTRYAQPATFVASMAGWRERQDGLDGNVVAMAGHSLGELSALAAAGALDPFDALRLVVVRARLMAEAAERSPGGMIAVLGVTRDEAGAIASHYGVEVANDNAPGQLVLSGPQARIKAVAADARESGYRALELDVTGAFHSPAMRPARAAFQLAVESVRVNRPAVPIVSGLTAARFRYLPYELSGALVEPVRWREVMDELRRLGAEEFVDVGPGQVLARLVKRNPARAQEERVLVR